MYWLFQVLISHIHMFNESTTRRRHNPSSSSNNSTIKQVTTATQKFATQSQNNIMMGCNASDEPTMSWVIVCAILYVLSGVTQVSYFELYVHSKMVVWYKSAHLMRLSHSTSFTLFIFSQANLNGIRQTSRISKSKVSIIHVILLYWTCVGCFTNEMFM